MGGDGSRDGPATGSAGLVLGVKAGAAGVEGVLFLDGRRVETGTARAAGEGAASSFIIIGGSGTSSGNTVTPTGGDGGGIDGN